MLMMVPTRSTDPRLRRPVLYSRSAVTGYRLFERRSLTYCNDVDCNDTDGISIPNGPEHFALYTLLRQGNSTDFWEYMVLPSSGSLVLWPIFRYRKATNCVCNTLETKNSIVVD